MKVISNWDPNGTEIINHTSKLCGQEQRAENRGRAEKKEIINNERTNLILKCEVSDNGYSSI